MGGELINNEELISVIVPIYNVEKYLYECIDSICRQTYNKLEIILVNDGSKDNCGKICDEYAKRDKRIKVIHKENGGLSSARNAGLDIAKGEYISFIDSDDKIANNFFEKLYKLSKINNADIVECNFLKFENEITVTETKENIKVYSSREMQHRLYSDENIRTKVVWNKLYKKYIYKNLRFPLGKINEDEFCTYKAFDNCKKNIVIINLPLYYYRYNPTSIMGSKFSIKRYDILEALEERENYYIERKYDELYVKTIMIHIKTLIWLYTLTIEHLEDPTEKLKYIHNKVKNKYKKVKKDKRISLKFKLMTIFFIKFPNRIAKVKKIKFLNNLIKKYF